MSHKTSTEQFLDNNPQLRAPHQPHIRTIKPEFFAHEGVAELSPLARLAWIGLWTHSDKNGRFPWRPKRLKTLILPYDDVDFAKLLEELVAGGFVKRYSSGGEEWGVTINWDKHQGLGTREKASKFSYPAPLDEPGPHSAGTVPAQDPHNAMSLGVGVGEGVGEGTPVVVAERSNPNQLRTANSSASGQVKDDRPEVAQIADMMAQHRKVFDDCKSSGVERMFGNPPKKYIDAAWYFYKEADRTLLLAAFGVWLLNPDPNEHQFQASRQIERVPKEVPPMQDFYGSGKATTYSERLEPLVKHGLHSLPLLALCYYRDLCIGEILSRISVEDLKLLDRMAEHQDYQTLDEEYRESGSLKKFVARLRAEDAETTAARERYAARSAAAAQVN